MIYVVSPAMIISHVLPDHAQEDDYIFQREVMLCQSLGIDAYLHKHNTEIQQANAEKKKKFWRGKHIIEKQFLMRYFSRLIPSRLPLSQLQLAS